MMKNKKRLLFSELAKIAKTKPNVSSLLYTKRCFGPNADLGIVTVGCQTDFCKTVADLVAKGHTTSGLEWVDEFLLHIPTVSEIPEKDFIVFRSRYSDGQISPWEVARREQEIAKARAILQRNEIISSIQKEKHSYRREATIQLISKLKNMVDLLESELNE